MKVTTAAEWEALSASDGLAWAWEHIDVTELSIDELELVEVYGNHEVRALISIYIPLDSNEEPDYRCPNCGNTSFHHQGMAMENLNGDGAIITWDIEQQDGEKRYTCNDCHREFEISELANAAQEQKPKKTTCPSCGVLDHHPERTYTGTQIADGSEQSIDIATCTHCNHQWIRC